MIWNSKKGNRMNEQDEKPSQLGTYLKRLLDQSNLSARKYAEKIGIPQNVLTKLLLHGSETEMYGGLPVSDPQWSTFAQIARGTHTDIGLLARITAPSLTRTNAEAEMLATLITNLPVHQQQQVRAWIFGLIQDK